MPSRPFNDAAFSGQNRSGYDYSARSDAEAARAEAARAIRHAEDIAAGQDMIRKDIKEIQDADWYRVGAEISTEERFAALETKLRSAVSRIRDVERKSAFQIASINTILDYTLELCAKMIKEQSFLTQNFLEMRLELGKCFNALGLEMSGGISAAVLPESDFAKLIRGESKVFMFEDVVSIHQMGDEYEAKMNGYENTWRDRGFDFARSTGIPWLGKQPDLSRHVLTSDTWKNYPQDKKDEACDYLCFFRHLFDVYDLKTFLTGEGFHWIDEWRRMEKEACPVRSGWNLSLWGAAKEFAGKKSVVFKALHDEPWTMARRSTGTGEIYNNNMGKALDDMKSLLERPHTQQELVDTIQWGMWDFIERCEKNPEWQTGRRYEFTKEAKDIFIKLMTKNEEPVHTPHF